MRKIFHALPRAGLTKTIQLAMKLTAIILLSAALHVSGRGLGQGVTLSVKNASLATVFSEIEKQSGYSFVYTDGQLDKTKPVDLNVTNTSIETVLNLVFKNQPLTYTIQRKYVIVKNKEAGVAEINTPLPPITVKGRIANESGEPVQASVVVKGTKNGTTSDADGYFELKEVDENATLVISGVSIETFEVKIASNAGLQSGKELALIARIKVAEGEEVVVAYNKISQRSNVGAVTVIKGEQLRTLPNRSFDKSLQGLVPGLLITNGSGQPGGGVSNFVLRGIGSATAASYGSSIRHPLIVVDGVPVSTDQVFNRYMGENETNVANPLAQINTNDIESISVLKDADAIALYGSRAANGVILVTTKKGKAGRTSLSFHHQTDIATVARPLKVLDQDQYLELLYEAYKNYDPSLTDAAIRSDLISKFPHFVNAPGDTSFYPVSDWQKEMYGRNALTVSNDVSLSGGNEKNLFYLNFGYLTQNGTVKGTGFDRGSFRINYESRPVDFLNIGINTGLAYSEQGFAAGNSGTLDVPNMMSPLNAVRSLDGDFIFNYKNGAATFVEPFTANPVAAARYNINRFRNYSNITGALAGLRTCHQRDEYLY